MVLRATRSGAGRAHQGSPRDPEHLAESQGAPIWGAYFNAARIWCVQSWRETSMSLWQNGKSSYQALARFLLFSPRCDFSIVAGSAGNLFS
jgi:hypothetical protein